MSDNESSQRSELPKLIDDSNNNNYGEWEVKSYHKLKSWDLWKYVQGPQAVAPIIPILQNEKVVHGLDEEGNPSQVRIPGNIEECDQALAAAAPWISGNDKALAKIVNAVPSQQLHLVKRIPFAKQAWDSLCSFYQPRNSLRSATIKGDIMAYKCTSDMNVSQWLNDMQRLYNSLCDLAGNNMTDRDFGLAILDLMPLDGGWRDFLSTLRAKVTERDTHIPPLPINSIDFITAIRDEYWFRHKDDTQASAHIFTARYDASTQGKKRPRQSDTPSTSNKRIQLFATDKPQCANPNCSARRGHDISKCIAFGGGSVGQYPDWWRGPWNLHLPLAQRAPENNVPPKSNPAQNKPAKPAANLAQSQIPSVERSNTIPLQSDIDSAHVNLMLSNETPFHAWNTHLDNTALVATLPVLDRKMNWDDHCHHDSGANRHVFHSQNAFHRYQSIDPVTVKGFGHNLSTPAVGYGTVRLQGKYSSPSGDKLCTIQLTDVLHIPAARSNLISGIQLDKAKVVTILGNGHVVLTHNGVPIINGSIINDMYRLNLKILSPPPSPTMSLLSRIGPSINASHAKQVDFCTA